MGYENWVNLRRIDWSVAKMMEDKAYYEDKNDKSQERIITCSEIIIQLFEKLKNIIPRFHELRTACFCQHII